MSEALTISWEQVGAVCAAMGGGLIAVGKMLATTLVKAFERKEAQAEEAYNKLVEALHAQIADLKATVEDLKNRLRTVEERTFLERCPYFKDKQEH